jgi:group I intron endonuclease
MSTYFNLNNLLNTKSMPICCALLKYGYSNFSLEILEYCEPSTVISREQYYLARLKPQYNILPTAGSSLGHKHYEETKARMSETALQKRF